MSPNGTGRRFRRNSPQTPRLQEEDGGNPRSDRTVAEAPAKIPASWLNICTHVEAVKTFVEPRLLKSPETVVAAVTSSLMSVAAGK